MRALTVRQKIISASKESDSGIKYDASSVQSLFLHAVETGLADEIIRGKIRPLTQNPKVTDEDLIGAMSLAISAETEQSNKFNLASKGKSVKKELQKDQQVLATLKAVQAELATMKAQVKNLREAATDFLKSQLPAVQIRDIEQLLCTDGSINLQAANGTDIPYCG
ncbi:unnamed protein product [Porites evermanni]|uniref:Uncharacterized protein n=1 Tax=Porites evermanni TaxID=104178 RepID=A0ABN8MBZ2_9CNID|nr:unnamed protein product [Porites evermanni]